MLGRGASMAGRVRLLHHPAQATVVGGMRMGGACKGGNGIVSRWDKSGLLGACSRQPVVAEMPAQQCPAGGSLLNL